MSTFLSHFCTRAEHTLGSLVADPHSAHNLHISIATTSLLVIRLSLSHRRWPDG